MVNISDSNKHSRNQGERDRKRCNITRFKLEDKRKKIQKGHEMNNANEICRRLKGLGFSCKMVLIK